MPILRGMPSSRLAERVLADPHLHQIRIEGYDAQEGRIRSAWAWTEGMGVRPQHSTLTYSYSEDGKLQKIVEIWEDGGAQTVFAARTETSLKQLSAALSQRIAGRIIDALQRASFQSPLVVVELPYRPPANFIPSVVPGAHADVDRLADLCLVAAIDPKRWIELPEEDFSPEITEFMERMNSTERWESGEKMLRQAARMVTEFGRGQPWASEDFVAFAIDWESEGGELAKVLKACGADARTLKNWKKRGWI